MRLGKYMRLLSLVAPLAGISAACSDDPTDEGSGDAFAIVTNRSSTEQGAGSAFTLTATVVDRLGTPLPIQVVATSGVPTSVVVDSTRYVPELQETRFYLRSLAVNAAVPVVLTAEMLTDTVEVRVLSGPFPGTVATAAVGGLTVLVFTSTTDLFDANTAATITGGETGFVLDVTPTRLRYILPFGTGVGPIGYSITGAGPANFNLSGTFNLPTAIPCPDTANEGATGNDTFATATAGVLAVGTPAYGSGSFNTDPHDWFSFNVAEAGSYRVRLDWGDGTDADVYLTNAAGVNLAGFAGATGANHPENITMTLQPGTYLAHVELYDSAGGPCMTFKLEVTKL
jgi:hypothetical protein